MNKNNLIVAVIVAASALTAACGRCESTTAKEPPKTEMQQQGKKAPASFKAVREQAEKEKKPILLSFNGSDWCPWCIKLDQEVFNQKEFQDWANESVVIYVADFPQNNKQSDDVRKQNKELMEQYGVEGFPTVILIQGNGKEIARTGYRPGGVKAYIEHLKNLLKKL